MTFDMSKFMGGGPDPQLVEALNEATRGTISNSRRIRMIEDKLDKLESEFHVLQSNYSEEIKKIEKDMRSVALSIDKLRETVEESIKEIKYIHATMAKLAPRNKVAELEQFVQLVNPTQLLTPEDVERIVKKIIEEREEKE